MDKVRADVAFKVSSYLAATDLDVQIGGGNLSLMSVMIDRG